MINNLRAMWDRADEIDRHEGALAYRRYHDLMTAISLEYGFPLARTVAAFCALSPNNDYVGNLRSLITVLRGLNAGTPQEQITVSTYNHAKNRAISYLLGDEQFYDRTRGLKTLNFYGNILIPECEHFVTIDGHIYCAWTGRDMVMKDAKVSDREYREIKTAIQTLADALKLVPCQLQATLWFARKRTTKTLYNPQFDLFHASDDRWRTMMNVKEIRPFA